MGFAQIKPLNSANPFNIVNPLKESLTAAGAFIENVGQYSSSLPGHENMGLIKYGYEGLDMPVLFTTKGLIHYQRKINPLTHEEKEAFEKEGLPEEEIEQKKTITDRIITMEWVGANPGVEIIAENKTNDYHTYGLLPGKAWGYTKVTYKNLYPGIDVVYSFSNNKTGFEYSILAIPGADLGLVKMKYGGDIKSIRADKLGRLVISSDINGITESIPVSYYGDWIVGNQTGEVETKFILNGKEIHFSFPQNYDRTRKIVIDPFISSTTLLTGLNAGKAKDVDFDYAGNIYVTGGGDGVSAYKLAKYDATGNLQWTFSGVLNLPAWNFGPYYGGSVVDKATGSSYLGQGFNFGTGFIVVRINTAGLYDNYSTTGNPNFTENWKMIWSCNSGSPQIVVAGGGVNSNINLGIITPPSTTVTATNITGISPTAFQDMADMVIDPVTNSMYTIYASGSVPSLNNSIYKNNQPYSSASIAWNVASGYAVLQEANNRLYLGGALSFQENSVNTLALNASWLFYWDGKNLKAIDKSTGATVGSPLTIAANASLMQGGIIADACNNVFVGEANGVIKVYRFNGTNFDDAAVADIPVTGFSGKAVYDLAYNEQKKLLYASGDGFVASFDVSAYCTNTVYTLGFAPSCLTSSVTVTVSPLPPAGSTVTFSLFNGTNQLASNTTGVFTSLSPTINYSIVATVNQACSGTQTTGSFIMPGPLLSTTQINTTCGSATGSIVATGSNTTGPYTFSIDGITFQAPGNFNGLAAGVYTVTLQDGNGCKSSGLVNILNSNGPAISLSITNATCGNSTGTIVISATGGLAPYQYSLNGVNYQSANIFNGLAGGQYSVRVKDAAGCINSSVITVLSGTTPLLTATPASATCGLNNGSITAFGTGGVAPLQYSINSNTFQSANLFTNLTPGAYTVTVKDAGGCVNTTSVTVGNNPAPAVTATSTISSCANANGTITATGTGGVAPLLYSIDGTNYQAANIFTGLASGVYTVYVQDAFGCIKTVSVTVASTNGPSVSSTTNPATCGTNNGSITATGSGGVAPYQYSINGITYQPGTTFTGLFPGTYLVYVKDNIGCIGGVLVQLNNIAGPSVTTTTTPASCNTNDGTITANGTDGTGLLQYSIDGVVFQPGTLFTGLAPNTYTITVKDANNCIGTTTVTVLNAAGLILNVSNISSFCSASSGTIFANATGGALPYQFSINGVTFQASGTFSNISVGTYSVYVKDANGCIVVRVTSVIASLLPQITVTTVNANCNSSNGVITVNGSGGTGALQYNIDGGAYQSIGTFPSVLPGTHTVSVKDGVGCTVSQTVTVTNAGSGTPPTDVTFTIRNILPCTGALGKIKNIKGVPSGGGNNYTFSLDGGAFTTANQFANVPPGTHTITAKNQNGCTVSKVAVLGTGTPATATATVVGTACNTSNGSITITGVGPNTPYHASINGVGGPWITFFPPGANSITFAGLAAGTYSIIMADDADFVAGTPDIPGACLTTTLVVVPSTGGPSFSTSQTTGNCFNPNGSITASATSGTAPYNYSINGGAYQPSGLFSNLAPGSYVVTVKDAAGCISAATVVIATPPNPTATTLVTPAACGFANGSIDATGANGTAPLTFSIDGLNFQAGNSFTNLAAGTYTLFVKDALGCYSTQSIIVANAPRPQATAFTIAATCNSSNGMAIVNGSSGVPPYQFSLDGLQFQSSGTFAGLSAGFYTIYIKDARDCINTTGVSVGNTTTLNFTTFISPAKCSNANGIIAITASGGSAPYQYSIDGIIFQASNILSNLLQGDYPVTVKDANGCIITRNIAVSNSAGPHTLTSLVVPAACGSNNGTITAASLGGTPSLQYSIDGVSFQASTIFNSLAANSYTLYVKDINGCIKTAPVVVENLAGPTATATSTPASCSLSDGTITAIAAGGTGILLYSVDGISFQPGNVFTGLAAGSYTITVKDTRLCATTTTVTINPFVIPTASANTTDATCGNANGSISVNGSGGTGPYQYSLDGITFQASNVFNGLVANTYLIRVKDINGCTGTVTVTLSDSPPLNGTYTVGTGGDFNTLTAAVNAYNTQCIGGPITFLLTDAAYDVSETFPISINSNIYASSVKTLTIKPAPGTTPLISGNNDTAIIRFNGADYITIDGSNTVAGITRDLNIKNNSINATSTVCWLNSINATNAATNISVNNCIIRGEGSTSTFAAILSSGSQIGTVAEAANSGNLFQNNALTKAQTGIKMVGSISNDIGNQIVGNDVGSSLPADKLSVCGIELQKQEDCQVLNNSITGVVSSSNTTASGIRLSDTDFSINIGNNKLADIKNTNPAGFGSDGIYLGTTTPNAGINVFNNFVSDIAGFGNAAGRNEADNGYGIIINAGGGYNIYHNTIVLNTNQSVTGFPAALNITSFVNSAASINIKDNIFGNIQTQPGSHYGIQSTAANNVFASIDYNDFYTASGALGFINSDRLFLADIQMGFGSNTNSINITPVYVSATDLHIDAANVSNGVNLGDKGIVVGIVTDIDNTTRNGSNPDLGADEWVKPNYASWVGRISTDWLIPENWDSNVVPDGTTDVFIKGGFTFMPTIVTTQAVRDLNLSAPDAANIPILTLNNGTIQINGVIDRSGGSIDGLNGTMEVNAVTTAQIIPADLFINNALNNLLIGNSTADGVIIDGPLDIYRSLAFSPPGLNLFTGNNLTLKSSLAQTAWLGNMTGKHIIGAATIERYIPDHTKAWQFLSVPAIGQTIKDAWQEGSSAPNNNPHPGFGTQITSNVPNAIVHPTPGFDVFSSGGPSMKIYNPATGLYDGVSSTANPIENQQGYMLFVRGDRTVTTFNAPATATVLRTRGTLYTPDNPPAVANIVSGLPLFTFASVGNPYASAIDLTQLTLNAAGGGVQDIFYVWDPKLTTAAVSSYGLGGFQVLTRNGSTYDVTPGGGSYPPTNKFIQSGQAFFVNAPFTSGTVKFTEACKTGGSSMFNKNDITSPVKQLRTNLYVIKNGESVLIDGNRIQYGNQFQNDIDLLDAVKLNNIGENLGINSNGKILIVERRKPIKLTDTIFYNLGQPHVQQYKFQFIANDLDHDHLAAFLEDTYLHNYTQVSLHDTTVVSFTIENIAGSYAANRFRIVFRRIEHRNPLIIDFVAKRNEDRSAALNWKVENESDVRNYTIERGRNDKKFRGINKPVNSAKNNGNSMYSENDINPGDGDNYYRIKAITENGESFYSNIIKLPELKPGPSMVVYPNPVADKKLRLQYSNQLPGGYYIYIVNEIGQAVYNNYIQLNNPKGSKEIILGSSVTAGNYQVNIVSSGGKKVSQKIIIE